MVQITTPSSIWGQLASFCFLCSAVCGDLLAIRICLFLAYTWLLVMALVGIPLWPAVDNPGFLSVDGLVWAVLNLFFHGLALFQLIWDERRIRFASEEQEQVWRFFNRRSGMGRLEMQQSLKRARRVEFKAGAVILDTAASHTTLVLLMEGLATFKFSNREGQVLKEATLLSGGTFDIGLLNIFGVYLAFEKEEGEQVTLTATTDCLAYLWDIEDLDHLATKCAPAMPAFWRSFALCQVGLEWSMRTNKYKPAVNGRGQPEAAGVADGTARSSDFTDPLEAWEDPRPTLLSLLCWLPAQLAPFLPPGMRHTAEPHTGTMARNRLIALGAAHRSADSVLRREPAAARPAARVLMTQLSKNEGLFQKGGSADCANGKAAV